jgi:hypothetical protein
MLLGLVPAKAKFFICLDLKDAFFCIHLAPQGQPIFSFQWENPKSGEKGELIWTQVTQGFRTALASDLKAVLADQHDCTLLQYIDNLLLSEPTPEDCMEGICLLLSFMGKRIQSL